jgi:hypothetical protein
MQSVDFPILSLVAATRTGQRLARRSHALGILLGGNDDHGKAGQSGVFKA